MRRVERHLEHLLGLSDALTDFTERARADAPFWRSASTMEGLHRVGFATPFEGICWTILRQRQYPNVARARLRRLRETFGTAVAHDGELHHAFPAAEALAGASLEAIRRQVKSRKKARFLREAAAAFSGFEGEPDVLREEPEAVEAWLVEIRGVGPWTARTLLATAFSRPHLGHVIHDGRVAPAWRPALERFYGPDVEPALVHERANAYGRWEGYWLFYAGFAHRAMQRPGPGAR